MYLVCTHLFLFIVSIYSHEEHCVSKQSLGHKLSSQYLLHGRHTRFFLTWPKRPLYLPTPQHPSPLMLILQQNQTTFHSGNTTMPCGTQALGFIVSSRQHAFPAILLPRGGFSTAFSSGRHAPLPEPLTHTFLKFCCNLGKNLDGNFVTVPPGKETVAADA